MGVRGGIGITRSREREVRDAFHKAGALDPASAQPLADLRLEESRTFKRLQRHEVVRESSPGCYHFDDEVWQALRSSRFRMTLMIVGAALLTALVGLYAATANR